MKNQKYSKKVLSLPTFFKDGQYIEHMVYDIFEPKGTFLNQLKRRLQFKHDGELL